MSFAGANIGGLQALTYATQSAFHSMHQDTIDSVNAKNLMNHEQTERNILMEAASAQRVSMLLRAGIAFAACFVLLSGPGAFALDNGQARTPPMGWNSWNTFGYSHPEYSDQLFRQIADAMVSSGMKDAGYRYVNMDEGWTQPSGVGDLIKRDTRGGIVPSSKFPNMRALTSYVHSKGLSIGIYLSCESSGGHEQQDVDSIVAWGFDYLKYDFCDRTAFVKMRDYLKMAVSKARAAGNAAAQEIVYSMSMDWEGSCLYGDTVANLWRTGGDIDIPNGVSWNNIVRNLETNDQCATRSRLGAWNDPDMMVVGKTLPVNEDRAHFSLWCMVAAPLIAGNDLRSMSAATKTILTNAEMIAIDQDSLGFQGRRVKQSGNLEVWGKKLGNGDMAVCFLNKGAASANMSVTWGELAVGLGMTISSTKTFKACNLWTHQNLADATGSLSATAVPSHDVVVVRLFVDDVVGISHPQARAPDAGSGMRTGGLLAAATSGHGGSGVASIVDIRGRTLRTGRGGLAQGVHVVTVSQCGRAVSRRVVGR